MIIMKINKGKSRIEVHGNQAICSYELSMAAAELTKRNKTLAAGLIFGIAKYLDKNEFQQYVERAYNCFDMADETLEFVKKTMSVLADESDKNDKKE